MVSTIIIQPDNLAELRAGQAFDVKIKNVNIQTGFFDNPQLKYYATPQTLNAQGIIQEHWDGQNPPDAINFQFFKGLNAPDVNGVHTTTVTADKVTPGNYRICSITGTFGHQPVVMPVAQRGSQDDCIRITIK
ncbi:hypothetical protein BC829DRAFT_419464 [Chytridium lagenaria]|nr:hypothetical protein BC829DRAFT_419464 [Chytridium lagenaria]